MTAAPSEAAVPPEAVADPWVALRQHTAARIALGRSGASLPTREVLAFGLAHAQARDAVLAPLDAAALRRDLEADGWRVVDVRSRAETREAYLVRPDRGRRLHADSAAALAGVRAHEPGAPFDVVFVIGDGLSSTAVQSHAAPLLRILRPLLADLSIAPVVIAQQARVALADEIGGLLGARVAVSLIGERPGLSSPDSLGIYLTFDPRLGRNDSERNCISNVRPQGLGYGEAAAQLALLLKSSIRAKLSGVALRFDPARALAAPES